MIRKIAQIKQWKFFSHDTHNGVNTGHGRIESDFKPLPIIFGARGLDIFQASCIVVQPNKVSHCLVLFGANIILTRIKQQLNWRMQQTNRSDSKVNLKNRTVLFILVALRPMSILVFNNFHLLFREAFAKAIQGHFCHVSQIALFVHLSNILIVELSM